MSQLGNVLRKVFATRTCITDESLGAEPPAARDHRCLGAKPPAVWTFL